MSLQTAPNGRRTRTCTPPRRRRAGRSVRQARRGGGSSTSWCPGCERTRTGRASPGGWTTRSSAVRRRPARAARARQRTAAGRARRGRPALSAGARPAGRSCTRQGVPARVPAARPTAVPLPRGARGVAERGAQQRRKPLADAVDPRSSTCPSWPAQAGPMEREHLAGHDLAGRLPVLVAQAPLDRDRPPRALTYRLVQDCPAAALTLTPVEQAAHDLRRSDASRTTTSGATRPGPAAAEPRRGPAR